MALINFKYWRGPLATSVLILLALVSHQRIECLNYDGLSSFSIYPRLDLHLCVNSSLSFDFTISASAYSSSHLSYNGYSNSTFGRLLVYSEQQVPINFGSISSSARKLVNSYFLIRLVNGNRLIVNDYWNVNDVVIQLPNDYTTSWFRFVYTRRLTTADIALYRFEYSSAGVGARASAGVETPKLTSVFTKQVAHTNFIVEDLLSPAASSLQNNDPIQAPYSQLLVGGIADNLYEKNFSYPHLKQLSKFHGYIMNLQYTSLSSQCKTDATCSSKTARQYAIFSSSVSKQYKLQPFVDRDTLMIDDICESDTLTHDICPKDCSCLSNNMVAPYFNCDCSEQGASGKQPTCSAAFKSFAINLDDANYYGNEQEKFEYPILPSFTKINVENVQTQFDKYKGLQFKSTASHLYLSPTTAIQDADACFWNIDECANGFVQHMILSIDRLDEKKFNQKVIVLANGQSDNVSSKLVAYLYKNRLHFSIYEYEDNVEWVVSSFQLEKAKYLFRQLKVTLTWVPDKYMSLHFDGLLVDMITKPIASTINQDIYLTNNLNKHYYEFGMKLVSGKPESNGISQFERMASSLINSQSLNHQFTLKYIRRDYYNEIDSAAGSNGLDSKIIVSSPLPSEIIRIDNTQRVMYKIDSPLTGVTTETIELAFRTSQPDGVIFYIRNNPIITYFELIHGQPVVVIDTRFKNVHLRPQSAQLNDDQWHEVKLHRDGETISIFIDSQYQDSADLGQSNNILTGGYVYLGLADPNNINLSDKKTFVGEMVRGKVTINNVQQKVVQQPYYWPSTPSITTNQTVNIDTSQLAHDGKMINIIINVYGPPGFTAGVNAGVQKSEADTHYIYLDNLPDTRYVSVAPADEEIDFRVSNTRLEAFLIKFQTRQQCGQLVTLINDPHNYIGLEIFDGYLYSSTAISGVPQRYQISRVRVDDGRIYQVNLKQEQQKVLCWLDADDSYKQSIMQVNSPTIAVNTIRVAGQDGTRYGFSSRYGFVGCIGAILLNERDVIDYQFVPSERRQSCQNVITQPQLTTTTPEPPPPPPSPPAPPAPVSLGYISFTRSSDLLVFNYFYDHEKPCFEDISFIFRTVVSNGILFSAHNADEGHNPHLIGAYIRDGLVHVLYLNSTYTQDLCFDHTTVDDGSLYRLNIRRNSNGQGFIQLQSYVGVTALDFYTQPGQIKFSKIIVGGADEWSRVRYYGTRPDFIGCIIDLFQVNGNSVIKPAEIPSERYNCNVERPRPQTTTTVRPVIVPRPQRCLPHGYTLSFSSADDAVTYTHESKYCEQINLPFRTREGRGIIYSHTSDDCRNYIIVFLRRGFVNIIVKDNIGEKELEIDHVRVDDGELHELDIQCEASSGYLFAYIDKNRQSANSRVELSSSLILSTYTIGYYDAERLSSKYSIYDNFRGCIEQVTFNKECLIYESMAERSRLTCSVQPIPTPAPIVVAQPRLRCFSDSTGGGHPGECSTDGVCYAALWRNSSGVIERYMRCFNREQLQPLDNPFLCRSQDPTRYAIMCCDTDYCNRNLQVQLKEVNEKDERSVWKFRGPNSGDIKFIPYLSPAAQSELVFHVNASRLDGTLMCTKDDHYVLKTEFKDGSVQLSLSDLKSRRVLKTASCRSSGILYSDNKWHKIAISKRNRGQITISCDDSSPQTLQFEADVPFVNTKSGVSFGLDCGVNAGGYDQKRFNGELSNIVYSHNGFCYSLEDLQYSEDSRFTYEGYVEFRPKYSGEIYSDPKPIKFRSKASSARINKWDESKVGRISFEFKTEIADENGLIFSTESAGNYFAVVLNNGYLESILSPHRVPNADSSSSISFYDRYQRLFPFPRTKVNDGQWHKFEFMMLVDSVASLVLDDDFSTKIRFPMSYWNDESSIVFGTNLDIQRDLKSDLTGSFRGCIRNIVINNRLIDWSSKIGGTLFNIEAGCFNDKYAPSQLPFLQSSGQQNQLETANSRLQFNADGCVRFNPNAKNAYSDRETVEFLFRTKGDRMILFDSLGGEFVLHTQGPTLVIRAKDDSSSRVILERGIAFNDGSWHKVKIDKYDTRIEVEVDGKYRQQPEFIMTKRTRLGPFYVGCSRNSKLNIKLVELRDFNGQIQGLNYYCNSESSTRVDLIDRLIDGDSSLLLDGHVQWTVGSSRQQSRPSSPSESSSITLRETSSYVKLDRINEFDSDSNLSFNFKTNEQEGLLAFISPGSSSSASFIAVELVDGSVTLLANLGNQLRRVSCSPTQAPMAVKYNDNKWHTVTIRRDRLGDSTGQSGSTATITFGCDNNFARVKVSDSQKLPLNQFASGNITQSQSQALASSLWQSKSPKFLGCLGGLKINQREVDLYQSTSGESRSTISRGCQEASGNSCSKSSASKCANQGECVEGYGRTSCNCDATSYTGARCELLSSTLSFNGSHGIEFAVRDPVQSSSEEISLRFKTRLRNGVLFALKKSSNEPSLVLSLEDGRAKCVYDREVNDKVIYVGDHNQFNNNKWHTIHVKRTGATVLLEVIDSDRNKYYAVDDLNKNFINVNYRFVDIGSCLSQSLRQEHPNFIGWIQNVKFNGEDLISYYNGRTTPYWSAGLSGSADSGESSLLLHHQITFTSACPINLPRTSTSDRFNIHLFFKTSQENGVIFFRRGKEFFPFMALELSEGVLRFVFDLGGGLKVLESPKNAPLNDKNWHEVTIKRFDRQKFSMKIDENKELLVDIGSNSRPLYELETFVVGGVTPDYQKFVKDILGNKGFVGCLASLEINNDAANLYSNLLNLCSSVLQGCFDSACYPNPCYNNGQCSPAGVNQVKCNCDMTSYTGQFCRDDSVFHFFGGGSKKCGLIKYTLIPPAINQESDRLAFGFTTIDLEATLVKIESDTGDQFIEILLKDGQIILAVNLNGIVESKNYQTGTGERFDDNRYHVVQFKRDRNEVQFRVDNFEQLEFSLKGNSGVFRNQLYIYAGALQEKSSSATLVSCYYGILSGMVFNGHKALDNGIVYGDVTISSTKYIDVDESNRTHTIAILADGTCPLGYDKGIAICTFSGCPIYSESFVDHSCRCYYGYYQKIAECVKLNDTVAPIVDVSAKYIPAKVRAGESPIGLILGIISGIALAILAAALAARKCADGLCIPAKRYKKVPVTTAAAVSQVITGTATTTNDSYEASTLIRREEQQIPLIQRNEQFMRNEEYYRDALDFGYRYPPAPIFTQSVNETMEMFEQTSGGMATTAYNTGTLSHSAHHASHRDLAMDSLFYSQNNAADYELSNVTCVTMTPNGKYAIIGQSMGTPQIWDTISGQLIRSMGGISAHCNNLTLCCNGSLLVGLINDGSSIDGHTQALQIWEVQTGKPVQLPHQIKCCVFTQSADTNSIFMAGNQRFGRGISVGILDMVTNELTKEIKSDPSISFGENPESIVITPDERHAIVGCKSVSGTNFVVFDITKANEIAQTRSIALDADPKCIQVLNNNEVLTGTRGGHLIQWNIHSCKPTASYVDPTDTQAHRGPINMIALSSDKEHLVSASSDCTCKVWSTISKNLVSVCCGHRGEITCASISNNDLVVTGSTDQTVGLWRLYSGNQISSMSVGMNLIEVNMARHNKTIVAIGEKDGEQQLLMLRVINVQR